MGLLMVLVLSVASAEAADPERWEKAIVAFEKEDLRMPPPKGAYLFLGSSSIRMWESLDEDFPGRQVIRRGFGGSHMSDAVYYAPRIVLPYAPKKVLVYEGDNDLAAGKTAERVLADFKRLVGIIHGEHEFTKIAFITVKPSPARWHLADKMRETNLRIKTYTETDERLEYIDVFHPMLGKDGRPREEIFIEDGLHMNREGYELWGKVIGPYLKDE